MAIVMTKDGKVRPMQASDLKEVVDRDERINQLERLNKALSAEIDLLRPVIEACQLAKRNGLIGPNSGFTVSKIYHAVVAYEAAKERG